MLIRPKCFSFHRYALDPFFQLVSRKRGNLGVMKLLDKGECG